MGNPAHFIILQGRQDMEMSIEQQVLETSSHRAAWIVIDGNGIV
jgi:hypothetical protein